MSKVSKLLASPKFRLYGSPVGKGDKSPACRVNVWGSNVGFAINTNSDQDPDPKKFINAPLSYKGFHLFLTMMRDYVTQTSDIAPAVEAYTNDGEKSAEGQGGGKRLAANISFTRNDEGIYVLMIVSSDESRPQIPFEFGHDYWFVLRNANTGEPLPPDEVSKRMALAWIDSVLSLLSDVTAASFEEQNDAPGEGKEEGGSNQNTNNYYRNNNNGGGKPQWNGGNNNGGNKQWNGGGGKPQWNGNGGGGGKPWQNKGNGGGWNNNGGGNKPWQNKGGGGWNGNNGGGNNGGE